MLRATGILVDPLASNELLIPGEASEVTIRTFADDRLEVTGATLRAPRAGKYPRTPRVIE